MARPDVPVHRARAKPGGDGDIPGWVRVSRGLGGFATSELGESLGMAVLRRNALSSPGHRGKRRCLMAEEKLMGEKAWGSDRFLKTQPVNQSRCCGHFKTDQQK